MPDEPVIRLIEGLQTIIPIISVQKGTFETTTTIGSIHSKLHIDNKKKIELQLIFLKGT